MFSGSHRISCVVITSDGKMKELQGMKAQPFDSRIVNKSKKEWIKEIKKDPYIFLRMPKKLQKEWDLEYLCLKNIYKGPKKIDSTKYNQILDILNQNNKAGLPYPSSLNQQFSSAFHYLYMAR